MTDVAGRTTPHATQQRRPGGVVIRDCATLEEYQECVAIQEETWGRGFSERVPAAILRVSQRVGGVTAGAFEGTRMLGFVFGITGIGKDGPVHWSDMLAVRPEARGHGLGERLKRYQRERVHALGVHTMLWTFDPLVARNAHFNMNRLGAFPIEYAENMYGTTRSTLHGALPTDRFIVGWRCDVYTELPDPPSEDQRSAPIVNPVSNGTPSFTSVGEVPHVRVQVPIDVQPIIQQQPALAARWRDVTRRAFRERMAGGYRISGFVRALNEALPYYVLTRSAQ